MAKFKVGDDVHFVGWASQKYTIAEVSKVYLSTLPRMVSIYRLSYDGSVADGWYDDTNLVSVPTKRRYEIIRVVEAENETEALKVWRAGGWTSGEAVVAREVK